MAGLTSLLGIARDAMAAQAYGLGVTSQNVSNVNTPGYVRREALLETRGVPGAPQGGVFVRGSMRAADAFLERRLHQMTSYATGSRERDGVLEQVEAAFDDAGGTGLGSAIDALFKSFTALAASPGDPSTRAATLAAAGGFARQVSSTAESLIAQRQELVARGQGIAEEVNDLAAQIAALNPRIAASEASGADASDLRDRQGELLSKLSEHVGVQSLQDKSGQVVVLVGGVALVEGGTAASMSASASATDPLSLVVHRPTGVDVDIAGKVDGGRLAGLIEARDHDIPKVLEKLDQLAFDVAHALNAQHEAGVGLDGTGGRALFTVSPPPGSARALALAAGLEDHPEWLAAASDASVLPGDASNALALSQLGDALIAGGNGMTASEAYSAMHGEIALRRSEAQQEADNRGVMAEQAASMRDSVSSVSLDEEMVSLTRYQRAYEAAAKLIKTVDELLAQLIR